MIRVAEQFNSLHSFEQTFWVSALRAQGMAKLKDFLTDRYASGSVMCCDMLQDCSTGQSLCVLCCVCEAKLSSLPRWHTSELQLDCRVVSNIGQYTLINGRSSSYPWLLHYLKHLSIRYIVTHHVLIPWLHHPSRNRPCFSHPMIHRCLYSLQCKHDMQMCKWHICIYYYNNNNNNNKNKKKKKKNNNIYTYIFIYIYAPFSTLFSGESRHWAIACFGKIIGLWSKHVICTVQDDTWGLADGCRPEDRQTAWADCQRGRSLIWKSLIGLTINMVNI